MRRPTATTVSAASTNRPGTGTAAALARAMRLGVEARQFGRRGVSSMSGAMTAAGVMPICASSARRRGLDDASTSADEFP